MTTLEWILIAVLALVLVTLYIVWRKMDRLIKGVIDAVLTGMTR